MVETPMYVIVHTDRHGTRRVDDIRPDNNLADIQELAATREANAEGYGQGRDRYQVYALVPVGGEN